MENKELFLSSMFSKMTEISKQKGKLVVPPKLFMDQNRTILLYRTSN